ncbi:MAG: WecB/TagA/CpsF family glycosyltransferase, partial [Coriobacteriia bacterium]
QRDPALRQILNRAVLVTPDGMPLVWLLRLHGHKNAARVYGPDLLLAACEFGLAHGWRHYFYGGAPDVPELLAQKLSARFPGLLIAGLESPPFHALTPAEDAAALQRINAARPDIVWVGLGAPKQEYWMAQHLGSVQAPLMIGVGAAFDFHAGLKKQAPLWMQRSGLEWLFRLFQEPRRLWRRYLLNNPLFILLVVLQLLGIKKFQSISGV